MSTYWTIQKKEAWEEAQQRGYLIGSEQYVWDYFLRPYRWMIKQMNRRIGHDGTFPVWLWLEEPDLNAGGHGNEGEVLVCLEVEVDDERVLVSDIDAWHCPLNDGFLYLSDEEERLFRDGKSQMTQEESWERIFDLERMKESDWGTGILQGVTGRIPITNVKRAQVFVAKNSCPECGCDVCECE